MCVFVCVCFTKQKYVFLLPIKGVRRGWWSLSTMCPELHTPQLPFSSSPQARKEWTIAIKHFISEEMRCWEVKPLAWCHTGSKWQSWPDFQTHAAPGTQLCLLKFQEIFSLPSLYTSANLPARVTVMVHGRNHVHVYGSDAARRAEKEQECLW